MEYPVEMAQALVIASTALLGITGLFFMKIQDIKISSLTRMSRLFLSASMVVGFVALLMAILWFWSPNDALLRIIWFLFLAQVISFVQTVIRIGILFK